MLPPFHWPTQLGCFLGAGLSLLGIPLAIVPFMDSINRLSISEAWKGAIMIALAVIGCVLSLLVGALTGAGLGHVLKVPPPPPDPDFGPVEKEGFRAKKKEPWNNS